jgi:nitrite reductase (NADH) small subunit
VHGGAVACPLHNLRIALASGVAQGGDEGCTPVVPVRVSAGRVLIDRAAVMQVLA